MRETDTLGEKIAAPAKSDGAAGRNPGQEEPCGRSYWRGVAVDVSGWPMFPGAATPVRAVVPDGWPRPASSRRRSRDSPPPSRGLLLEVPQPPDSTTCGPLRTRSATRRRPRTPGPISWTVAARSWRRGPSTAWSGEPTPEARWRSDESAGDRLGACGMKSRARGSRRLRNRCRAATTPKTFGKGAIHNGSLPVSR